MTERLAAEWRPMQPSDLPAVAAVAEQMHPNYPERPEIFAERLSLYPAGCHVLARDGDIMGYVLSHPWRAFNPPKLDTKLNALPPKPNTYYLHDISILAEAQGRKRADAVLKKLIDAARVAGLPTLSLVAVNDSVEFWMRRGFEITETPELAARLGSYDAEARFMVLTL